MNDFPFLLLGYFGGKSRSDEFCIFVPEYKRAQVGIFLNPLLAARVESQ
jgi:hypothetical protein